MFKKEKGFTLIELLVVIAIIGLLSSVVLISMSGSQAKAKASVAKQDAAMVMKAMEMLNASGCSFSATSYGTLAAAFATAATACGETNPMVSTPTAPTGYTYALTPNPATGTNYVLTVSGFGTATDRFVCTAGSCSCTVGNCNK